MRGAEPSAEAASPSIRLLRRTPRRPARRSAERPSAASNTGAVCWIGAQLQTEGWLRHRLRIEPGTKNDHRRQAVT